MASRPMQMRHMYISMMQITQSCESAPISPGTCTQLGLVAVPVAAVLLDISSS